MYSELIDLEDIRAYIICKFLYLSNYLSIYLSIYPSIYPGGLVDLKWRIENKSFTFEISSPYTTNLGIQSINIIKPISCSPSIYQLIINILDNRYINQSIKDKQPNNQLVIKLGTNQFVQ